MTEIDKFRQAVIVDLDWTLSDPSHREHHFTTRPVDWDTAHAASAEDPPHWPVLQFVKMLNTARVPIVIMTGRPIKYQEVTRRWLVKHKVGWDSLIMRPDDDFSHDVEYKERMLDTIVLPQFGLPQLALEDRRAVVDMFRRRGIMCWQVREEKY